MTKKTLRLGREVARKPVRLTFTIGPDLAEELKLYAEAYEREYGETQTPSQLAPHMIRAFLASDPGFKAAKRQAS
ncbi:DUF2274 domain-containing protein [Parvularcula oceani]|uniref:DUF2274 domain-containing protein n=1 Tax=Parvularcula oceani TaxID=1247963 RepID=UPI0004E1E2B2|nr:DUF2274 domain-containing protein [Parvularcula oceani]